MEGHMAKPLTSGHTSLSALDAIEQATAILKRMPLNILAFYYFGAIPFILGFLYFCADMSKNPFAHEYCLAAAFGMTLLFIWMKTFQAFFCTKTYGHLIQVQSTGISLAGIIRTVVFQTCIQASALIVLPIALIVTIPFAWTSAAYQMALIHDYSRPESIRGNLKNSFEAAKANTFSNHMILLIFTVFTCIVFLNVAVSLYIIPVMLKTFLGIETIFTLGGFNVLNTTFLLTAACITYLLTDPLIKVVYVIQKYDFTSRSTGDDLLSGLGAVRSKAARFGLTLSLAFLFILPPVDGIVSSASEVKLDPAKLDASVKKVISKREYAWRLPRPETPKAPDGFFYSILKWTAKRIKEAGETIAGWMEKLFEWLRNIFSKDQKSPPEIKPPESGMKPEYLTALLLLFSAVFLCSVLYYLKKIKSASPETSEKEDLPTPDIEDENLLADQLPSDQWMVLANQFMEKGEFRLAVRALYLSGLAALADRNYIRIAGHKSNRDYLIECSKKSARRQMLDDFRKLVSIIDRAWYGMHTVNRHVYDNFLSTRERMIRLAEK